jgi:hypothetical protein
MTMRRATAIAIATGLAFTAVPTPASAEPNPKAERVQQCRTEWESLKTSAGLSFPGVGKCVRYAARGGSFGLPTSLTLTLVRVGNWDWDGDAQTACSESDYPAGCFQIRLAGTDLQVHSWHYWWYEHEGLHRAWLEDSDYDGSGAEDYSLAFVCGLVDGPMYVTGTNSAGEPIKSNELDAPC